MGHEVNKKDAYPTKQHNTFHTAYHFLPWKLLTKITEIILNSPEDLEGREKQWWKSVR